MTEFNLSIRNQITNGASDIGSNASNCGLDNLHIDRSVLATDHLVEARIAEITEKVAPKDEMELVDFNGITLIVNPNVFNPVIARSTKKMIQAISDNPPMQGSNILEIGTGTGVLSIVMGALFSDIKLTATDIDPRAIDCANINFRNNQVDVRAIHSNLFENVPAEKFDYIVFNAPTYHPCIKDGIRGATSLWDMSGSLKNEFLKQSLEFIAGKGSKILIMYSRYASYDCLASMDFSGFNHRFFCVEKDEISEAGVLLLEKQ